jgi:hypothetical protein
MFFPWTLHIKDNLMTEHFKFTVSFSQEILHLAWNTKVHYSDHNSPTSVPVYNELNQVSTLLLYFLDIPLILYYPYSYA